MIGSDTSTAGGSELDDCSQLYHHTVPILDYDRYEPSVLGTGVLVGVDQQHFVITAAHVFESGLQNVGFGFLGPRGFELFGAHVNKMKILTAKAQTGAGDPQRAVYKDGLDLAVIEPPARVLADLQSHYRSFDL